MYSRALPVVMLSFLLASCGGGGGSSTTQTNTSTNSQPVAPNITGNWDITASSAVFTGSVEVGGSLVSSGSQITGVVHVLNSSCFTANQYVAISGSVTPGSNALALTSASVVGQVVTANGTVSSDGKTLSSGTYSIAGGCGNGDHGTITGFIVPSFSNTYSGSFTSNSGPVSTVTVTITQVSSPDADGLFHVTGTLSFPNSQCFSSGSIVNSAIAGGFLEVEFTANTGADVIFAGNITDSSGKTITGQYQVNSGICAGDLGSGSISHS